MLWNFKTNSSSIPRFRHGNGLNRLPKTRPSGLRGFIFIPTAFGS